MGDMVTLQRGHDLPSQDRRDGQVPIISSSGVSGFHDKAKAEAPGVVTGRYGTLGQVFFIDEPYWPLNTALYVVDFKGNDPKFIYYFLKTVDYLSASDKSSVPGVNRNHLHELPALRPPLNIQKRIAAILGSLDDKIELNRRMNETLEAMARAIFRSWFVDFDPVRIKDRGGDPTAELGLAPEIAALFPDSFQESELGPIPTGWEPKPIGAHVAFNDCTLGSKDFLPALEYIEISGVSKGDVLETSWYNRAEAPSRARRRLRHGDTVVSTVRPEKGAYFLALEPHDALIASTGFAVLSPADVPWSFVHAAMTQPEVFEYMGRVADGGAYPAISPALIGDLQVTTPCNEAILEAFHGVAKGLYELSQKLRAESRVLAETRDYLLPRLLSGKLITSFVRDMEAI